MRRRRAFGPVWWLRVMVGLASTVVVAALTVGAVAVWLPALLPGYKAAAVVSGSMRPVLDEGDLVVFSTLPPPDERGLSDLGIDVGDVILFISPRDGRTQIVHRVIQVTSDGRVATKGDANSTPDNWLVEPADIRGKVRFVVPYAGTLAYLRIQNRPGSLAAVLVGVAAVSALSTRPRLPRRMRGRHSR